MHLRVDGRIWIDADSGPLLGIGKIELLEKIKHHGSIRKAALEMKMSYRQAWQMIDSINKRSGNVFVELQRGGKGGGKASLTAHGEKLLAMYHEIEKNFRRFLDEQTSKLDDSAVHII